MESVCQQTCWIFADFFPILIAAASWQADMHMEMILEEEEEKGEKKEEKEEEKEEEEKEKEEEEMRRSQRSCCRFKSNFWITFRSFLSLHESVHLKLCI